jgi:signal transduction histidine kinase
VVTWLNVEAARGAGPNVASAGAELGVVLDALGINAGVKDAIWRAVADGRVEHCPGSADETVESPFALSVDLSAGPGHYFVAFRHDTGKASGASDPALSLLSNALDAMPAEVAILESSGRIVGVNRAWREFARLNGFRDEHAGVGSNYLDACDSADGAAADEARAIAAGLRSVLGGSQSATYVEYPCDSPEEQRWFQVRATGFQWQGARYAVVSHESLTETKRAEQRHREQLDEMAHQWRMSSLGELASGIAHELNQPLGAITNYMNGCLRRLEAGTIDREQLIGTARECAELAEFAAGIIKRMRGFASHSKCQYQPMSLNGAVSKAMQFFRASPESGRVRLTLELGEGLPRVRGDDVQIQQVALNLVRNAADAVLAGGRVPPRVQVSTYRDGDGMVCLAVADNGHGLPDGVENRLFEPFFSTKSKGMGLGLSISKTNAEVHGGRLIARNVADGEGAVFELKLPPLSRGADLGGSCAADRGAASAPPHTIQCKSQGGAA